MDLAPLKAELAEIADQHSIDRIGFCTAEVFNDVREALHTRKAQGLSADMAFTYRNPDRATDPTRALPGAKALVVGARSYRRRSPEADTAELRAEVAEYVWEEHYVALRAGLDALGERLRADGWKTRTLIDDNALVDRAAAHRAGIGWWGKSANILVPEIGSKVVLGSVVTDAPLAIEDTSIADQCGTCRRCIDQCPTGAIVADGVIDANRCLARGSYRRLAPSPLSIARRSADASMVVTSARPRAHPTCSPTDESRRRSPTARPESPSLSC